jgi:hypothetical protein
MILNSLMDHRFIGKPERLNQPFPVSWQTLVKRPLCLS